MRNSTKVTGSRLEIEQDGQVGYLEFETDSSGWMTILHTEVPEGLRGKGLALELVTRAFQHAKENAMQVDVICPLASHLGQKHPELGALLRKG
jgi:uncharacterized protein